MTENKHATVLTVDVPIESPSVLVTLSTAVNQMAIMRCGCLLTAQVVLLR